MLLRRPGLGQRVVWLGLSRIRLGCVSAVIMASQAFRAVWGHTSMFRGMNQKIRVPSARMMIGISSVRIPQMRHRYTPRTAALS
jgi:hypothetical protein